MGYAPPNSGLGGRSAQRKFEAQKKAALEKEAAKKEARRIWHEQREAAIAREKERQEAKKNAKKG